MKKITKIFAIILSLCLIFSICPFGAFAESVPEIESIQVEDIVIDADAGYFEYDNEAESYYYCYGIYPNVTVTFKDGTVFDLTEGQNWFDYDGYQYVFNRFDNQSYNNQWKPGNTYTVNYEFYAVASGIEGYKGSYNVTLNESPISDFHLDDIVLYDGLDSYYATDSFWDNEKQESVEKEYKAFDFYNNIKGNVTFADGDSIEFNSIWIDYNGKEYEIILNHNQNQSYDNPWEVGGTYTVTAELCGLIATFNVTVCENPVESVTFDDVEVIECTTGYYYYPSATIKFKDGKIKTVEKGNSGFEFEDNWYQVSFTDNQDETPWEVGNTYTVTGTIMGVSSQFNVTVLPTPLKSIQIDNIKFYENLDGYEREDWIYDPDSGTEEWIPYYYYDRFYNLSGTATFSDGTTQEFSGSSIEYLDEWYYLTVLDNQENEHWEVGNTYTVTGTVMGVSTQFDVTIKEIPFESFTADDVVLSTNELNDYYDIPTTYHFIRKDGSEYTTKDQWVYLDNCGYYISMSDYPEQNWTPGEYEITATFGKLSTTFTVTASDTKSENGFSYLESKDGVIITGIDSNNSYISVPTTLSGKNVIGINSLGIAQETVKNLVIPNGVKFISSDIFSSSDLPLETLCFGKDIADFNAQMLECCPNLKNVYVDSENQYYSDDDGVLYNKSKSKLVWYPLGRSKKIELSSYIEDFSVLELGCYSDYSISFVGEGGNYITEDGVTYNADKTYIIFCDKEKSGTYDMPDTVTDIRSCAFLNCKKLTEVNVSNSVTEITYMAFAGCDSLKDITLPDNLTSLGFRSFSDCPAIEEVVLPDKLEKIEYACFENDTMLSSINFPESLCELGSSIFSNTGFTELNLPSDEHIEGSDGAMFADCKKLKKVTFAEGRRYIDDCMFINCPLLESVTMPDTVKWLYDNAFSDCPSLKSIKLSQELIYLGHYAFENSGLQSIDIPDSVEYAGVAAFSDCTNLKVAKIGSGLYGLSPYMFTNTALEEIEIPENIEYIGEETFAFCSKLKKVLIENQDTEIATAAFAYCPLEDIPIPKNSTRIEIETYKGSKAKSVTIPNTVTDIMYGAFEDSTDLLDIKMPTHLDSLGRAAFDNTAWYNAKPDGYITIDDYILYGYKGDYAGDTIVNIDKNISVLAGGVFENGLHGDTSEIERIIIPEGVKSIPENAFDGCTNLKSVTIPKSVESIYHSYNTYNALHSAFNNCPSLTDIYYFGTEKQWNELTYEYYDDCDDNDLQNVNVHFADEIVPFRISVEESLTKKVYEINENFKIDEFAIRVLLSDGTEKILTDGFTVSGFDSSTLGTNNLTVSYDGLTCTCPITIEPHKVATSGKCGENITWELNLEDGILSITGSGNMYDYANTDTPWFESLSDINSVVFGKDVTTISAGTFSNCENLKSITVYNANTVINDYIDDFITVIGNYGSKAHRYAIKNGYEFIPFPETIEIFALPKQIVYAVGELLKTSGLTISVCNPNGTVEYRNKGFTVSGYDNEKVGKQTLTVDYLGMTATFEIEVKDDIIISNPNAQDLTRLIGMLLQTETTYLSYDFNCDGVVNILDLVKIKKHIAYK